MGKEDMTKQVLLTNGDSWTFGSEIMAPEFCMPAGQPGTGMAGRYKPGFEDFMQCNDYYRIPRTWPSYLKDNLGIPNVINLAKPARSNDTIYEDTINWIMDNYISIGKDTSDLLVVIGWSSPERKNMILADSGDKTDSTTWFTIWPAMIETQYYASPIFKEFFKFYVSHQWAEQEFIKRYVEQNFHLQNFCKLHNIDYYVFNAFYAQPRKGPDQWQDVNIATLINSWGNLTDGWHDGSYNWNTIRKSLIQQWKSIDKHSFVNKDHPNGSFRSYIYNNVEKDIRMCNWHPSPESHEAWAKFLYEYISK